ncbi:MULTISPECIES: Nif3-like dinuclear metal center hexameric protein [unclassified Helicobacter]|uniref:Nif3-like dinuclear metal center hexameric protein n=1 Tax=unclassified Helicobacter TaxID=2593540 RepID=UPI000CF14A71|nr:MULTISPECIES: Nif3-like dinuclear metal center hexameric protein [unclassified Helicobacter]
MRVREIYDFLQSVSPFEKQEEWDNGGLQIGSLEDEIEEIVLALEVDDWVVENLKPKSLLIVHHPLIFKGLRMLDFRSYPSLFIRKIIQKECALIAMHTSFDVSHLNIHVAKEILGFRDANQDENGIVYAQLQTMTLKELTLNIKQSLRLPHIRFCDAGNKISRVAVVCGSGFSLFSKIKNKEELCFLTGDVKYHDAMIAKALGVSTIDITHYESEIVFGEILQRILQKQGYKAIITNPKNPFTYI